MNAGRGLLCLLVVLLSAELTTAAGDEEPKRLHLHPRPRIPPQPTQDSKTSGEAAVPSSLPGKPAVHEAVSSDDESTSSTPSAADEPGHKAKHWPSPEDDAKLTAKASNQATATAEAESQDGSVGQQDKENQAKARRANPSLRTSRRRKASSARRPPHASRASDPVQPLPRRDSRRPSLEASTATTSQRRGTTSRRQRPASVAVVNVANTAPRRGTSTGRQSSAATADIEKTSPRRGTTTYRTSSARVQTLPKNRPLERRVTQVKRKAEEAPQVSTIPAPFRGQNQPVDEGVPATVQASATTKASTTKSTAADEQAETSQEQVAPTDEDVKEVEEEEAAVAEGDEIPGVEDTQKEIETSPEQRSPFDEGKPNVIRVPAAARPPQRIPSGDVLTLQRKRGRTNVKPSRRGVTVGGAPSSQRKRVRTDSRQPTRQAAPSGGQTPKVVRVPVLAKVPRRRTKEPVTVAQAPLPAQTDGIAAAAARVAHRVEPQPKAKKARPPSSSPSSSSGGSRGGGRRRRKKGRSRSSSSSRAQIAVRKSQIAAVSASSPPPVPSLPVGKEGRKIVCYYTNWSQYRPAMGKFMPENIDPFLCTHIVFAFSSLTGNRLSPFEQNDLLMQDGRPGLYAQVTALKQVNPRLKVLLAIGGWSFGTKKFKDMSSNRYNRRTFVYSVAPYLRNKNFDGLDLDWEYPKGSTDKKNFAELCKELREAFEQEAQETGQERLLLTAAVPVGPDTVRSGYDVRKLARYLDLFHIMAYDFHGKWERQAGHNAPLNAPLGDSAYRRQLSVNASVHMWMAMGAPKHKIVLGMPTYGRSFTLSNPGNTRVNAPTRGGGVPGHYTKEEGFLAYYEICQKLHGGAAYVWDEEMSVPYLIDGDQWVGFDDERAIRIKMDFIRAMDLGGAMVWSVDMDDFAAASCGGAAYPLMTAIREELLDVPRQDNKPDIDWSKIAKRQAPPPPLPLAASRVPSLGQAPGLAQISVADILAILKAQGITPDLTAVQKLQAKVARSRLPSSSVLGSPAPEALGVEDNLVPPKIFCYITGWARDRPGRGRFTPADLDPNLCTHVVWAFAGLTQGHLQLPSDDQERDDPDSDYKQILRLKEANRNLKILLSLGGQSVDSEEFRSLTSSDYRMNTFVYDTVDGIRRMKLDGLDVAWEYPSGPEDRDAFSRLIREFRLAFDSEASANRRARLLLTVALPGNPADVEDGYDIPEISQHADFLNLMTYDLHGAWEDVVGHNAPLYPLEGAPLDQQLLSLDGAARELIAAGAPPEKTLIGLATYGRSFMLEDPAQYDIGAPVVDAGKPGRWSREPGFAAYFEVCELLDRENTTLVWDDEQEVPFAFNGDYWVGFDDEKSLEKKVSWMRELGFGGVQIWAADLDDFGGSCGTGPYPLLTAVQRALDGYRVPYTFDGVTAAPGAQAGTSTRFGAASFQTAAVSAELVTCENEDNGVTYHRDPLDCKHYYLCQGSVRHHMPCPSDLVFNEAESVCDWPENVEQCWAFTAAPPAN